MAGPERATVQAALAQLQVAQQAPLAVARLWDRSPPATSQRRAVQTIAEATAVFGGNRAGKTELAAQVAVATALGGKDPTAQAWARACGFPLDRLPARPGRVLMSALTHDDSRRYHRPKLDRYLPPGTKRRYWSAKDTAEALLPGGGVIVTKAAEQGADKYQGDWFDLAILDEEHPQDVYEECLLRVASVAAGWVLLTMTPLQGKTWVYYTFCEPDTEERRAAVAEGRVRHSFITGTDNPWMPAEKLGRILAGLGPLLREARTYGRFVALEGRIYPPLVQDLHIQAPPPEAASWPLVGGLDFGFRNPTALVLARWDERDDTLWVVAEYQVAQRTMRAHAQAWRELLVHLLDEDGITGLGGDLERLAELDPEGDEAEAIRHQFGVLVEWIAADPEDAGARATLAAEGFATLPAYKAFIEGVEAVSARLVPDVAGRPHLILAPWCTQTRAQIENLRWKPGRSRTEEDREAQIKKDDHLADALRYLCATQARMGGV